MNLCVTSCDTRGAVYDVAYIYHLGLSSLLSNRQFPLERVTYMLVESLIGASLEKTPNPCDHPHLGVFFEQNTPQFYEPLEQDLYLLVMILLLR